MIISSATARHFKNLINVLLSCNAFFPVASMKESNGSGSDPYSVFGSMFNALDSCREHGLGTIL